MAAYYCAPMSDSPQPLPFPLYVDLRKVFSQKAFFEGSLDPSKFARVAPLLASEQFKVAAELRFLLDRRARRRISGKIKAELSVACQRCLQPLEITLEDDIDLALVSSEEQAAAIDDGVDPWIEADFKLDPAQIVEEQLLLSMPLASYHDRADCAPVGRDASKSTLDTPQEGEANPFAILQTLKGAKSED